jgi:hypothetical protein
MRYGSDKEQNSAADSIRQYSAFAGPGIVPPLLEILREANNHTTEQLINIQCVRIERRIDNVHSPMADMLRLERFANRSKNTKLGSFITSRAMKVNFGQLVHTSWSRRYLKDFNHRYRGMRGFNSLYRHNIAARGKFLSEMSSLEQHVIRKGAMAFHLRLGDQYFPRAFRHLKKSKLHAMCHSSEKKKHPAACFRSVHFWGEESPDRPLRS